MTDRNRTPDDLDRLTELHEAVVADAADRALAETMALRDTDADDDMLEAEACLRLLERVRQMDSGETAECAADVPVPQAVGHFEVLDTLGEGSYGTVYLARDPELNRRVAVKVPRPEVVLSPRLRDRFLREAEVAASLQHPAIVPVHQAGRADGTLFISSEYVAGCTLAGWLARTSASVAPVDAARLMLVLANAVQHAHNRGVLHRDLKPSNILLQSSEGPGEDLMASSELARAARITDFGLARFIDAPVRATLSGAIVGTPAYMAPEQAAGADVTSACDIYALGSVLYELLTTRTPFSEGTVLATLEAVRLREVTPPSKYAPDIPRDLEAVCLKCLEKDPARRYGTAAELSADVQRFLNHEPVQARRTGRLERAVRWCRRNPAVAAASSLAAVSLISGLLMVTWQWQRAEAFGERADRDRIVTRNALDAMTSQEALSLLTRQSEITTEQRAFLESVANTYRVLAEEEPDSTAAAARIADAHRRVGVIYNRLGENDTAETEYLAALRQFEQIVDAAPTLEYRRQLAQTLRDLGTFYEQQDLPDKAEPLIERLRELVVVNLDESDHAAEDRYMLAVALDSLANLCYQTDRQEQALKIRGEAIEIREKLVAADPDNIRYRRMLSVSYNNHGNVFVRLGRLDEAEPLLLRALNIKRDIVESDDSDPRLRADLAMGLSQLAIVRYRMNETRTLQALMDESLAIQEQLIAAYPLNQEFADEYAFACTNWCAILQRLNDPRAVEMGRTAVQAWESRVLHAPATPRHHARLAKARLALANILRDDHHYDDAIALYSDAIAVFDDPMAAGISTETRNDTLMNAHWGRATSASHTARYEQALADWNQAIQYAPPPVQVQLKLARATTEIQMGRGETALATARDLVGPEQADFVALYNAACVFALASRVSSDAGESESLAAEAVELLQRSVEAGFSDLKHLEDDPELMSLHDRDDFQALFADLSSQ